MLTKPDPVFPDCFPPDFADKILPKGIPQLVLQVYRVCKYDTIDRRAFLSTYEETMQGLRPKGRSWQRELKKPGTYATSCSCDMEEIQGTLNCLQMYNPPAFIMKGEAAFELGPQRKTPGADGRETTHIDWWLYKDADPSDQFQRIEGDI